ncbi:MAG: GTP-binding protein, partial [Pseudomonadota bacterium]
MNPVPVYLLTGFLGSGKTTLLGALLKCPEFANTAVIVNEFGEIGLDHFLIERSQDNVVLLEAGCLCCTIADSLHETLADLQFRKIRGEVPRSRGWSSKPRVSRIPRRSSTLSSAIG